MKVSLLVSVSRRIRSWVAQRRNRSKEMRLNTPSSVMFISDKGKTIFKFLNK